VTRSTRGTRRRGTVSFALIAILAGAAILGSPWVRDRAEQLAEWAWGKSSPPATTEPGPPPASTADSLRALEGLIVVAERPDIPGYQRGCAPGEACSFGPAWTDDSCAQLAGTRCLSKGGGIRLVARRVAVACRRDSTGLSAEAAVDRGGVFSRSGTTRSTHWDADRHAPQPDPRRE
jgi:hypothetical protein